MSLPRYPEYKDSGVDWLGKVPAHWQVQPLKSRYAVVGGSTPKSDVPEYWDGDINWVTPADLSRLSGFEIRGSLRTITDVGLQSCGTSLVPGGSLILSTRAPIGSLGLATMEVCTNQGCKALVPQSGELSRFAAYALSIAGPALNVRGKGTTFLELSGDELASFRVAFPEREEQAAIATFLDRETAKIDALIAEQEKLLALLAEKRQATISHAVTRGLDPKAPMKGSGIAWLGELPAHWDLVPCRFLVSERDERNEGAANQNYLSLMANVGVIPYAEKGDVGNKKPEDLSKCKLVEVGDLVINSMNYGIGSYGLSPLSGVCSPVYIVLEVNQSAALREFVYRIFQNRGFQLFAQSFGNGILAHRAAIGWDTLKGLQVVLPSLDEQREIVQFVKSVEDTERQMRMEGEQAIALLKERRSALIAAAVTGQIDVRGAVDPEAA